MIYYFTLLKKNKQKHTQQMVGVCLKHQCDRYENLENKQMMKFLK